MSETIFALSSGALPSGVAIIRISGPGVRFALETMAGGVPKARTAMLRTVVAPDGDALDRGLVLFFPGPASFTGEDCAEFHLHGSRAVVARCLDVLGSFPRFRQAEPGEFSLRAFESGRMDLTEVEGLSDLIRADTEAQRRAALDHSGGKLRSLYESWMRRLTHARAMLEAELDFADEADIPGSVSKVIWRDLSALRAEIGDHLSGLHWGEIVRDGFRIALVGAPNAGKSTLLNRLADRDVAIVSPVPGTTRDQLEVRLDIGGHLVLVSDTAGLRETEDEVEREGIRRSRSAMEASDLVLLLDDGSGLAMSVDVPDRVPVWRLRTKSDLGVGKGDSSGAIAISAVTGDGIEALVTAIRAEITRHAHSASLSPNRPRHQRLLKQALAGVDAALVLGEDGAVEVIAESLRAASYALGRITGHVGVEDLLGVIFSEFCVGK